MGHNSVVSGHQKSIRIPRVDWLSTGPPSFGVSHCFLMSGYVLLMAFLNVSLGP